MRPVDMFPQTPHIECVALLEKVGPSAPTQAATGATEENAAAEAADDVALGVAAAEGSAAAESGA